MTIQRAREILGKQIENLSDDQVNDFISNMGILCDGLLKGAIADLTSQQESINNGSAN